LIVPAVKVFLRPAKRTGCEEDDSFPIALADDFGLAGQDVERSSPNRQGLRDAGTRSEQYFHERPEGEPFDGNLAPLCKDGNCREELFDLLRGQVDHFPATDLRDTYSLRIKNLKAQSKLAEPEKAPYHLEHIPRPCLPNPLGRQIRFQRQNLLGCNLVWAYFAPYI
jgi:hypothetical protein